MNFLLETVEVIRVCRLLFLLAPHNDGCHDEEPDIDQDDHYDWSNEGPNKVCLCVQETAGHERELGMTLVTTDWYCKLTQCRSHSLVVLVGQNLGAV